MRLIRSRAKEWGIDPARIGAMGFSAGGELVAMIATQGRDRRSRRPPTHRARTGASRFPGPDLPGPHPATSSPTRSTSPAFLAAAYDDRQDIAEGLAEVYLRLKRAGVPAELHMYGSGGHGFGVPRHQHAPCRPVAHAVHGVARRSEDPDERTQEGVKDGGERTEEDGGRGRRGDAKVKPALRLAHRSLRRWSPGFRSSTRSITSPRVLNPARHPSS